MKKVIPLLVVLLFACKNEKGGGTHAATDMAASTAAAPVRLEKTSAEGVSMPPAEPAVRMIVRTATLKVVAADTQKAVEAITRSIEAGGGHVAGSNIWREGELLRATLTLRVPSAQLTSALSSIRAVAKRVENETISSEDVSQEYVDLGSRLRNLEATEVELRELLKSVRERSRKAADVLEVHQQLTAIRAQIEQIKGRMRYLAQTSSMSTISLEILPDAIAQPVVQPGWQPLVVAKNASRALIGALQSIATVTIWLVIYILPIAGSLMFAAFVAWKLARRRQTT